MNFEQMLNDAVENNGGTYKYDGRKWIPADWERQGYWVSQKGGLEEVPELTYSSVGMFVLDHPEGFEGGKSGYLGLWNQNFKGEPESWSIDVSFHIGNADEAFQLGIENGQKAIYDCSNDTVITL